MSGWWLKLLASAASGCLLFLACADFDIWPLAWVGFLPLLLVVRQATPRQAFFWGWLAGTVANAGGFYWINHLLQRFGHMHWAPAFGLFLLLVAYQGLHWGGFAFLVRRLKQRPPGASLPMALLAPLVMTAMELVMPFIFPWYLAITQAWNVPVIQVADLAGPLGVTFLLMLVNGLVYDLVTARLDRRPLPWRPAVATAGVLVLALGYGAVRLTQIDARRAAAPKVKVGVVQANVGITEKGRPGLASQHLKLHIDESLALERKGAELIVWPESAYPFAFDRAMERDYPAGHPFRVMRGLNVPLLFGVTTYSRAEKHPYNSAYMMEPDGRITGRFDKIYLLVFGEYIPFYERIPSFKRYFPEASHFSRGTEVTTFPFRDYRLGPMICYEDIIPSFGRRIARLRPHALINITNDAWFGRTSEPWEHLALAVFRSVELRLDLVRAVNTGVSAFVDANGRVRANTQSYDPVITPGVPPVSLLEEVAMMEGGRTLYAAVGDLFGYFNLVAVAGLLFWPRRRRPPVAGARAASPEAGSGARHAARRRRRSA